ncbi:hypothetical protein [Vallitalea sp.]|jgi:hypothetical protein|uniref:hypothetical protein n=1 Tax=Vallitalea sp. TaxID=1882829 RepID=UPI0025D7509F|nr:hypothetical protein [Vallitalea sp.]MCT4688257.1 hypothetical protein [Vallitalea sp.]
MNKHKYFFRGVGITLIITASIFYFIGLNITKKTTEVITEEEIILRAKELGMIDKGQIDTKKEKLTDKEIIDRATKLGMVFEETDKANSEENVINEKIEKEIQKENENDEESQESDTVKIKIEYGMGSDEVAELLFDNKVVDDDMEFDKFLMQNKLAHRIKIGTYEFKVDSTYEEVMKIFTN